MPVTMMSVSVSARVFQSIIAVLQQGVLLHQKLTASSLPLLSVRLHYFKLCGDVFADGCSKYPQQAFVRQ